MHNRLYTDDACFESKVFQCDNRVGFVDTDHTAMQDVEIPEPAWVCHSRRGKTRAPRKPAWVILNSNTNYNNNNNTNYNCSDLENAAPISSLTWLQLQQNLAIVKQARGNFSGKTRVVSTFKTTNLQCLTAGQS